MHTQSETAQAITGRHAGYVMTVKANMPTLYKQLKKQEGKSLVRTGNAPRVMARLPVD